MKTLKVLLFICGVLIFLPCKAVNSFHLSQNGCSVRLENDSLTIENQVFKRVWKWNNGNIQSCQIIDKENDFDWKLKNKEPDLFLPGESVSAKDANIHAEFKQLSRQYNAHLRVVLEYGYGEIQIKRIFKIYPDCPAISCEIYMKGKASNKWVHHFANAADLQNIEKLSNSVSNKKAPVLEHLHIGGEHWNIQAVEFFDVTDRFNNLVHLTKAITYKDCLYRGNLFFAENKENDMGFYMLKEAPTSNVQLHYPGGDFLVRSGDFRMIGLGLDSMDIRTDEWRKAYGYVTGVYKSGDKEKLIALRKYQSKIRPYLQDRDEMVMLNTWGDRGQDTRVNEAFCLNELNLASELGITHFQIDDGWQAGRSKNSAYGGSFKNIWSNPNYWTPDPKRFPNGLSPIVKRGKELGIEICLWFNPSIQNNYEDWQKDADALIKLYKEYGIRTFKIDGTFFDNKISESRLRNLYDKVMTATDWNVVLNLDATAGRRGGYFYFNEYGNIFLENRYTDWKNYYPYRTLRNLWMLSHYVSPQMLQIEFLNKWRNTKKYLNDPFAPTLYSFDYLFAITMAAQPLAWFEAANLPEEAFSTGKLIKKYKEIQHDFHTGYIFPVGDEPSGESWCGFQSVKQGEGYFLVYRENNDEKSFLMDTYFKPNQKIDFTVLMGNADSFQTTTDSKGNVSFTLPEKNSFCLFKYKKVN